MNCQDRIIKSYNHCIVEIRGGLVFKRFDPKFRREDFHHETEMNLIGRVANSPYFVTLIESCPLTFTISFPLIPAPTLDQVNHEFLQHKAEIWTAVCLGIKVLHSLNLIHNDLHPGNIIVLSEQPFAKIIDFGEANHPGFPVVFHPWLHHNPEMQNLKSHPNNDFWSLAILFLYLQNDLYPELYEILENYPRFEQYTELFQLLARFPNVPFSRALRFVEHGYSDELKSCFW